MLRGKFLKRVVEFSDASGLEVRLAHFPPYHSKYNPIERYWGGLEKSWNGYLLDSVETVLKRALESRLTRSRTLPWWDITIKPILVHS